MKVSAGKMDFTLKTCKKLFKALQSQGFLFISFYEYILQVPPSAIILRHDVDKLPRNALRIAQIEHELGIRGTYYFRITPGCFEPDIIEKIAALGHEIGYHYEDLSLASKLVPSKKYGAKKRYRDEVMRVGLNLFQEHLKQIRKYYPVRTICMHGSPLSKWDNRDLWLKFNYRDYDIIGEPYFDIDFNKVMYLTDTSRRWNGEKYNIRDKVGNLSTDTSFKMHVKAISTDSEFVIAQKDIKKHMLLYEKPKLKTTFDIIKAAEEDRLPDSLMITFHPQRWTNNPALWIKELIWQNMKNTAKCKIVSRQ